MTSEHALGKNPEENKSVNRGSLAGRDKGRILLSTLFVTVCYFYSKEKKKE